MPPLSRPLIVALAALLVAAGLTLALTGGRTTYRPAATRHTLLGPGGDPPNTRADAGPAVLAGARCPANAGSPARAAAAGVGLLRDYLAYSYGRAGAHPPFRDATRTLAHRLWQETHVPTPAQEGAHVTVHPGQPVTLSPGIMRVPVTVRNTTGADYQLTAVVDQIGCRWLAVDIH